MIFLSYICVYHKRYSVFSYSNPCCTSNSFNCFYNREECFSNSTNWVNCYVEPSRIQISFICMKPECPVHSVVSVQAHKKFRPQTVSFDIALLKAKKKIPCNHLIAPICLPISHSFEHSGTIGIIAGWGQTVAGNGKYNNNNIIYKTKSVDG